MPAFVFKLNSKGVDELLKSARVQQDLKERADKVATAANNAANLPDGFLAAVDVGKSRARASVFTATADAMVAEAKDRVLTRAFDKARG